MSPVAPMSIMLPFLSGSRPVRFAWLLSAAITFAALCSSPLSRASSDPKPAQPPASHEHGSSSPSDSAQPKGHPLKGVIVDLLAERQSLLVKHEQIPGVMRAMTMALRVDDATLAKSKKGQAITATLYRQDGEWWLRDVQPAP